MQIEGWRYYVYAAIPTTAPHMPVDLTPVEDGRIWSVDDQKPLLVRYTSDFDCGYETNWWYVIKDTPFDLSALKAKRRYEITKGIKNFEVRQIVPQEYAETLYEVAYASYQQYPAAYRPRIDRDEYVQSVQDWVDCQCYGAFDRETGELCGYALLYPDGKYMDFRVMKTVPASERKGINAALTYGILEACNDFLATGGYLCDGSRNINHETAFQDYLEKYFGFRKAYCKLHIRYKGIMGLAIKCAFPFRNALRRLDGIGVIHLVNGLLKMEEMTAKREKKDE